jgi:hypothetical protein
MPLHLQTVLFPKAFTSLEINRFVRDHKLKPIKPIHQTARFKRLRISEPNYSHYITKKLPNGVEMVFGRTD